MAQWDDRLCTGDIVEWRSVRIGMPVWHVRFLASRIIRLYWFKMLSMLCRRGVVKA